MNGTDSTAQSRNKVPPPHHFTISCLPQPLSPHNFHGMATGIFASFASTVLAHLCNAHVCRRPAAGAVYAIVPVSVFLSSLRLWSAQVHAHTVLCFLTLPLPLSAPVLSCFVLLSVLHCTVLLCCVVRCIALCCFVLLYAALPLPAPAC